MSLYLHIKRNFLARGLFALSNIAITVYMARVMGAAESGRFFFLLNNFAVAALVGSLCLETGMSYFISKNEISSRELSSFIVTWSLMAGLLSAFVFFILFRSEKNNTPSGTNAVYALIFISGTLCTTYYTALCYARKQFFLPLFLPACSNLLLLTLCLVSDHAVHYPAEQFITAAYIAMALFNALLLAFLYHRHFREPLHLSIPDTRILKKIWNFSRLALATNMLSFLALRADYWILDHYMNTSVDAASLGNYIQVSKMYQAFLILPNIIATVLFPVTASSEAGALRHNIRTLLKWVLAGTSLVVLGLGISGKWVFPFIFGSNYAYIYPCFLIAMPGIISLSVISILAAYFAGNDEIKYNLGGSAIAFFLVTALNFLLVPHWGIYGAAAADSIGYFGYLSLLLYFFLSKPTPRK